MTYPVNLQVPTVSETAPQSIYIECFIVYKKCLDRRK